LQQSSEISLLMNPGQVIEQNLIKNDAQTPNITLNRILLARKNLRRHVVRGADGGTLNGPVTRIGLHDLSKPKIGDFWHVFVD